MPAKEFVFQEDARKKLLEGIRSFAHILGPTFGPNGLSIGIGLSNGSAKLSSSAGLIGRYVELKDPSANMGAILASQASSKIRKLYGTGGTLSVLLLLAFVESGIKFVSGGNSPIALRKGIEKAIQAIEKEIEKKAIPTPDLQKITLAGCQGNSKLSQLLFDAIQMAGTEKKVVIKEGTSKETTLEPLKGIRLNRGYISSHFCTNLEKMTCELSSPKVLVTDQKIHSIQDILPILERVAALSYPLLIIAEDIDPDALATLTMNNLKGTLQICAIKAPGFGASKKAALQEIATLCHTFGASLDRNLALKNCGLEVLGSLESATILKDEAILIGNKGKEHKDSPLMACLSTGNSLPEEKEQLERGLAFVKACLEKGASVGGGLALLRAGYSLSLLDVSEEEKLGILITQKALEAPFRQLVKNAGLDPSIYVEKVRDLPYPIGFNAATLQIEDLMEAGILDPAITVIEALKAAGELAIEVLLTEVLIGEEEET